MALLPDDVLRDCPVCSTRLVRCRLCRRPQPKFADLEPTAPRLSADDCPGCTGGLACPGCGQEGARGAGWSSITSMVAIKSWKEEIRAALDVALSPEGRVGNWAPVATVDGSKVNREAWAGSWHLGIQEDAGVEGQRFRGMAECEARGVRCRLPSAWVDRVRQVCCPEAPGRSE